MNVLKHAITASNNAKISLYKQKIKRKLTCWRTAYKNARTAQKHVKIVIKAASQEMATRSIVWENAKNAWKRVMHVLMLAKNVRSNSKIVSENRNT